MTANTPSRVAHRAMSPAATPLRSADEVLTDDKWLKIADGYKRVQQMTLDLASKSVFGDDVLVLHNVKQSNSDRQVLDKKKLMELARLVHENAAGGMDEQTWLDAWQKALEALQKKAKNLRSGAVKKATSSQLADMNTSHFD